jgi:hypothetical protein
VQILEKKILKAAKCKLQHTRALQFAYFLTSRSNGQEIIILFGISEESHQFSWAITITYKVSIYIIYYYTIYYRVIKPSFNIQK